MLWLFGGGGLLGLISLAKSHYGFTIPDAIELPLCLLIVGPTVFFGFRYTLKGLQTAGFQPTERPAEPKPADPAT